MLRFFRRIFSRDRNPNATLSDQANITRNLHEFGEELYLTILTPPAELGDHSIYKLHHNSPEDYVRHLCVSAEAILTERDALQENPRIINLRQIYNNRKAERDNLRKKMQICVLEKHLDYWSGKIIRDEKERILNVQRQIELSKKLASIYHSLNRNVTQANVYRRRTGTLIHEQLSLIVKSFRKKRVVKSSPHAFDPDDLHEKIQHIKNDIEQFKSLIDNTDKEMLIIEFCQKIADKYTELAELYYGLLTAGHSNNEEVKQASVEALKFRNIKNALDMQYEKRNINHFKRKIETLKFLIEGNQILDIHSNFTMLVNELYTYDVPEKEMEIMNVFQVLFKQSANSDKYFENLHALFKAANQNDLMTLYQNFKKGSFEIWAKTATGFISEINPCIGRGYALGLANDIDSEAAYMAYGTLFTLVSVPFNMCVEAINEKLPKSNWLHSIGVSDHPDIDPNRYPKELDPLKPWIETMSRDYAKSPELVAHKKRALTI